MLRKLRKLGQCNKRSSVPSTMANEKEVTMETREAPPSNMLIKIESFSLFSKHGIRKYESRDFAAAGYQWRLIIYPDGDESEVKSAKYVSVYFSAAGTTSLPVDWEVNAVFSVFFYNHILDNYLCFRGKTRRFHAMNLKWGFPKLVSKKFLMDPSNGYLVDDKCVFGAEVFVVKSERVVESVSVMKDITPCKLTWKISEFSQLQGVCTSEEFATGCYRWKIRVHPNGIGSGEGRNVSIFLESVDSKSFHPHQKIKADFCITIQNTWNDSHSRSVNFSHGFTSSEHECGEADFMSVADMHDLLISSVPVDCCYVEIQISVQVAVDSDAL